MLAACADPPPSTPRLDCSSLGKTTSGFGAGPDRRAIFDFLCPGLLAMERAPCESLRSVKALAALLTPVSQAPLCCKLGWSGIRHSPHDLAAVLIALAGGHEQAPMPLSAARGGRVRLATIGSGNGWVPVVAATYLRRVSGGDGLQGLLVGEGKSEWNHHGDLRQLLKQLGLYYRDRRAFAAPGELALLAHDQPGTYRSVLMPTAVTNASDYLPKDWKRDEVPPFDACLRAVPAYEHGPTLEDFGRLAGFCRLTAVFTGPRRSESEGAEPEGRGTPEQLAAAFREAGGREPTALRVGNFTVLADRPASIRWPTS